MPDDGPLDIVLQEPAVEGGMGSLQVLDASGNEWLWVFDTTTGRG